MTAQVKFAAVASFVLVLGCGSQAAPSDGATTAETAESASETAAETGDPIPDPVDLLAELYDPTTVQEFELDIAAADQQAMLDALPELVYVPATFHWRDVTIDNVGVRFKGNSSSSPSQTHKRSYLIKFGEYVPGQRFLDLRRVALDNGVQFGSLFSERLISDILRERGVTTSRSNYARLVVNGEYQGVYVNVERIDESFLKHHFADDEGPLYKVHEGGPGARLEYLGDDPAAYGQTFENKGDARWDGDLGPLITMLGGLAQTPQPGFGQWFGQTWQSQEFARALPVLLLAGAFDQYTGWNAHNYYLYLEPSSGRWSYLAWDLDVGFADSAFGQIPVIDGWNAAYPYPVGPRPLLAAFVGDAQLLADYRADADLVLEQHFHPDVLVPKLHELHALIADDLVDDPFPPVRVTNPGDIDYDSIVASLEDFIELRYMRARAELDDPQDTPPDDEQIPPPGEPSPDDPSDLHVIDKDATHVHLGWTDNATNEGAIILQRCTGAGCVDFQPHIGSPPDTIEANDVGVEPGMTYRYRVYALIPNMGPQPTGPSNVVEVTAD